jgi:hypothetical protein
MTSCSNHENVPLYIHWDLRYSKSKTNQLPYLESINESLRKLSPRNKELVKVITTVAFAIIAGITAAFTLPVPLALLLSVIVISASATEIYAYKKYLNKVKAIENSISSLIKEYKNEFAFLQQKYDFLIPIQEEDFKRISPYCTQSNPLQYKIREQTHFKFKGGIIGKSSIESLKLEEVCKVTNSEKVIEKYKPWVDLLIDLSKNEKIGSDFLYLIGQMAGFNRSYLDRKFYEDANYICTYGIKNEEVIVCSHKGTKQIRKIQTLEECRNFVQQELLNL